MTKEELRKQYKKETGNRAYLNAITYSKWLEQRLLLSSEAEKGEGCYDAEDYRKYQVPFGPSRCPVCGGNGIVDNGFYGQTSGTWVSAGGTEPCRSCNGSGVLWPVNPYSPPPPSPQEKQGVEDPNARIYPCADCGAMRSKAEGGTVFTVCDDCWDKYKVKPTAPAPAAPDKGEGKGPISDVIVSYTGRKYFIKDDGTLLEHSSINLSHYEKM